MQNMQGEQNPPVSAEVRDTETRLNSLWGLASSMGFLGEGAGFGTYGGQTISSPYTLAKDMAGGLITLDWPTLTYSYAHGGLIQTLIDQPVEDAMRGGFKIETGGQLDDEDLAELMRTMEDHGDFAEIKQTTKWGRLFGGGALLMDDGTDPTQEFTPETLKKGDEVIFLNATRWEAVAILASVGELEDGRAISGDYIGTVSTYTYYGEFGISPSRVRRCLGVYAPPLIRRQLQGWGMSELERCLPELNSYLKWERMFYELMDEAKVDVFGVGGYNTALATEAGTERIRTRIQLNSWFKNYKNALVMDKDDTYQQKTLGSLFSGLAQVYQEIRLNLCAALKIPENKLFSTSASGLNASDEGSIENYNALVETVRKHMEPMIRWVVSIRCQTLFGFIPEFTIVWPSLRVMTAKEQEEVNTLKQARAERLFSLDVMSVQSLEETLTKDGLLSVKLEKSPEFRKQQLTADQPDKPAPAKAGARKNALSRGLSALSAAWRAK